MTTENTFDEFTLQLMSPATKLTAIAKLKIVKEFFEKDYEGILSWEDGLYGVRRQAVLVYQQQRIDELDATIKEIEESS